MSEDIHPRIVGHEILINKRTRGHQADTLKSHAAAWCKSEVLRKHEIMQQGELCGHPATTRYTARGMFIERFEY